MSVSSRDVAVSRPLVSVVIPTFKRSDFLDRALSSVLSQTYGQWEAIVVDDNGNGSEDRERVRKLMSSYQSEERISTIEHASNRGGAAARNSGIRASRGRLVAFLDDDDEWKPTKLAKQVRVFGEGSPNLAVVYTAEAVVREAKGDATISRLDIDGDLSERLLGKNVVGTTSTVMCKRDALIAVGCFDESLEAYQDHDLFLRLARDYEFSYIDEPLVIRHVHAQGRITSRQATAIDASERMLAKHKEAMSEVPERLAEFQSKQGMMYLDYGDHARARRKFAAAIRANPPHIDAWPYLAVAVAGPWAYRLALKARSGLRAARKAVRAMFRS